MRQVPSPRPRRDDTEPPWKNRIEEPSPTPIYVWAGIAAAVLILILFYAFGSSSPPQEPLPPKPRKVEAPPAPSYTRPMKPDTGSILFVCANSGRHEDEEVILSACPCGAQRRFFVDKEGGGYRCLTCGKLFDNALVKCPKCGRIAVKTHLRPAFD